jgi:hypothetical protein
LLRCHAPAFLAIVNPKTAERSILNESGFYVKTNELVKHFLKTIFKIMKKICYPQDFRCLLPTMSVRAGCASGWLFFTGIFNGHALFAVRRLF